METVENVANFFDLIRGDSMLAIDNSAFMSCFDSRGAAWDDFREKGFALENRFELEWLRLRSFYNILAESDSWFVTNDIKREFSKGSRKLWGIVNRSYHDHSSGRDYRRDLLKKRSDVFRLMRSGSIAWYDNPADDFYKYVLDVFVGSSHESNPHPDVDLITTALSMAPSCPVDMFTHDLHLAGVFAECYENMKDSLGFEEVRVLDEVGKAAFSPVEFLNEVVEMRKGRYSRRCY